MLHQIDIPVIERTLPQSNLLGHQIWSDEQRCLLDENFVFGWTLTWKWVRPYICRRSFIQSSGPVFDHIRLSPLAIHRFTNWIRNQTFSGIFGYGPTIYWRASISKCRAFCPWYVSHLLPCVPRWLRLCHLFSEGDIELYSFLRSPHQSLETYDNAVQVSYPSMWSWYRAECQIWYIVRRSREHSTTKSTRAQQTLGSSRRWIDKQYVAQDFKYVSLFRRESLDDREDALSRAR